MFHERVVYPTMRRPMHIMYGKITSNLGQHLVSARLSLSIGEAEFLPYEVLKIIIFTNITATASVSLTQNVEAK